jgi:uncharacterized membrane protein
MPWNHMGWNGWWHMGYAGLTGIIVVLVVLVLLVVGVSRSDRGREACSDSPEEILKRRYAQGAIGKEEYDRKLVDLHR